MTGAAAAFVLQQLPGHAVRTGRLDSLQDPPHRLAPVQVHPMQGHKQQPLHHFRLRIHPSCLLPTLLLEHVLGQGQALKERRLLAGLQLGGEGRQPLGLLRHALEARRGRPTLHPRPVGHPQGQLYAAHEHVVQGQVLLLRRRPTVEPRGLGQRHGQCGAGGHGRGRGVGARAGPTTAAAAPADGEARRRGRRRDVGRRALQAKLLGGRGRQGLRQEGALGDGAQEPVQGLGVLQHRRAQRQRVQGRAAQAADAQASLQQLAGQLGPRLGVAAPAVLLFPLLPQGYSQALGQLVLLLLRGQGHLQLLFVLRAFAFLQQLVRVPAAGPRL